MSESTASTPEHASPPAADELATLPAGLVLAYAARAVLRVLPVFGQFGAFSEVWPVDAEDAVEVLLRSVQTGLAAIREEGEKLPFGEIAAIVRSTSEAPGLRGADPAIEATIALLRAAEARFAGDQRQLIASAEAIARQSLALVEDRHDQEALIAALRDDFHAVRDVDEVEQAGEPMQWYFRRSLWRDGRATGRWHEWRDGWERALASPDFAVARRLYRRWETGEFDLREEAAEVAAWVRRTITPDETEVPGAPGRRPPPAVGSAPAPAKGATPAGSPPAAPTTPARSRRVEERFGNDTTTADDTLNRAGLAHLLASFLRDPRTKLPLTLSIEGRWGSGKSTLMRLLDGALTKPADTEAPPLHTVWFNPWRYQSHEELWAEFALVVVERLRATVPWWWRWWCDLRLTWQCLDRPAFLRSALGLAWRMALGAGLVVVYFAFAEAGTAPTALMAEIGKPTFWRDVAGPKAGVVAALVLLWQVIAHVRSGLGGLMRYKLEVRLDRPDYAGHTTFLTRFHRDLARVTDAYCSTRFAMLAACRKRFQRFVERPKNAAKPNWRVRLVTALDERVAALETWLRTRRGRLVVFIDDLDRCEVPRAADLMQGINLMLGEDAPIIYVLGLDRAKVAAGIAQKHGELLPFLYAAELAPLTRDQQEATLRQLGLRYGYEFIEKFIQVPFRLPPTSEDNVRSFIRSRLSVPDAPSPPPLPPPPAPPPPPGPAAKISGSGTGTGLPPLLGGPSPAVGSTTPAAPPVAATTPGRRRPGRSGTGLPGAQPDESHLEEPLWRAARVLENNPRRIAQLVNLVRLQRRLAHELGQRQVREGQLAKWTAVALRWPMFLVDLEDEPAMLAWLVAQGTPNQPSARYQRWEAVGELVEFLRDPSHGAGETADDYDLTAPGVVDALLRLSVTVPVARVTAAAASTEAAAKEAAESVPAA